jgi:hypothetical protein
MSERGDRDAEHAGSGDGESQTRAAAHERVDHERRQEKRGCPGDGRAGEQREKEIEEPARFSAKRAHVGEQRPHDARQCRILVIHERAVEDRHGQRGEDRETGERRTRAQARAQQAMEEPQPEKVQREEGEAQGELAPLGRARLAPRLVPPGRAEHFQRGPSEKGHERRVIGVHDRVREPDLAALGTRRHVDDQRGVTLEARQPQALVIDRRDREDRALVAVELAVETRSELPRAHRERGEEQDEDACSLDPWSESAFAEAHLVSCPRSSVTKSGGPQRRWQGAPTTHPLCRIRRGKRRCTEGASRRSSGSP